jgi:isopenicillin N synthase-like dioxygenase
MDTAPDIPLIDLTPWREGDVRARAELVERLDHAMQTSGFFMVAGHGIDPALPDALREAARRFFALPFEIKQKYRTHVAGRGWLAAGDEANSYVGEAPDPTKADLKESLTFGRVRSIGDPAIDHDWFRPNVWPTEVPELEALGARWMTAVGALYDDILVMFAAALGLPEQYFVERVRRAPHNCNINRYPPMTEIGRAADGQFRVAAHTDWGMLTILDRQPGLGGLQVQQEDGSWVDAPHSEGAFIVNIGDLLARWTGDRWRSTRHRVLPPSDDAPTEELVSLIVFLGADMDGTIESLAPPIGRETSYEPLVVEEYYRRRAGAAQVG